MSFKYKGRLSKSIVRQKIGIFENDAAHQEEAKRIETEILSKIPDLFIAHNIKISEKGINQNDWFALVLCLAKTHVPGFKVIDPAGRKTSWTDADKAELKIEIDRIVEASEKKLPIIAAIRHIKTSEGWKEKYRHTSHNALKAHYYDADLRWVEIVKDANAYALVKKTVN
jgi:hypothetical protein